MAAIGEDETGRFSGGRDGYQRCWAFAFSSEVMDELVAEGGVGEGELFEEPEDALGLGVLGREGC